MKIATVLDHIDSGHMALPEFQRGYVWNREQVRGLFDSLYRRHPVGGLLVWATEAKTAVHRGDSPLAAGVVKMLLSGPVAAVLNHPGEGLAIASAAGYRCFMPLDDLRSYITSEVLLVGAI